MKKEVTGETVCPVCNEENGMHIYRHLFDVHSYAKSQREKLKLERKYDAVCICECGKQ